MIYGLTLQAMKHLITVILTTLFMLAGCRHNGIVEDRLLLADSLMSVSPDSAYAILDTLDSSDATEMLQSWHALLLVKANEKTYRRFHNDSLTKMAAEYFRGRGDSLEIQALFYNGVIQGYNRNYADALIYLIEATEKAAAIGDRFYQAMAYREQADIYSSLSVESKHLEYADSAQRYFSKAGRPVHALREKLSLVDALVSLARIDSAARVLSDIRSDSAYINAPAFNAAYHRLMCDIYTRRFDYQSALNHLDSVADYTNGLTSVELSQRARLLAFLGEYRMAYDALGQANLFAFESADSAQIKLSEAIIAARTDDYQKAYKAFMYFFNNYAGTSQYLVTHPYTSIVGEYYRQQSKARNDELRLTRNRLLTWIAIAALTAALAIAAVVIYRRRLREKAYQSEALLSDIQHLQKIIDIREKEAADTATQSARQSVSSRYAMLNKLYEIAGCMPDSNDGYTLLGKNVSRLLTAFRTDEALNEIEDCVNRHFGALMARFREQYPDMTERNRRFVLLSFAGFSNQSITTILDVSSPNALRTMRHRIRKQIEDTDTPDRELFLSFLR